MPALAPAGFPLLPNTAFVAFALDIHVRHGPFPTRYSTSKVVPVVVLVEAHCTVNGAPEGAADTRSGTLTKPIMPIVPGPLRLPWTLQ